MQLLIFKANNQISYLGEIQEVTEDSSSYGANKIRFKVTAGEDRSYYVDDVDNYNLVDVEEIPDYVKPFKWCYTEEKGFFENEALKKIEMPKPETEILKERLAKQEQTLTEQEQILAEQDELLAMLLLG